MSITCLKNINFKYKTWAKSNQKKAIEFGNYLVNVFKPNPVDATMDTLVLQRLDEAHQLDLPIRKFKCCEVKTAIGNLIDKKSAGYDLITPKLLKEMPEKGVKFLTQLFNAIISTGNMPCQWKVAKIIMILKPGKNANRAKVISSDKFTTYYIETS